MQTCGAGGMGWLCTAPDGTMLFEVSAAREVVASALTAEALALKAAIADAVERQTKDLICYSDSKSLIKLIPGNKSVIPLQGILHDIDVLSKSLSSISFVFLSRSDNAAADCLAKEALFLISDSPLWDCKLW